MTNTMLVGYKLVNAAGVILDQWGGIWGQCPDIPNPLILPDGTQCCGVTTIGPVNANYAIEGWYMDQPIVVPAYISRRQCATQLRNMGYINQQEALAMASVAAVPPFIELYFANLDPIDQDNAELAFTAVEYPRQSSLLVAVMEANGLTPEQINAFFIEASKL